MILFLKIVKFWANASLLISDIVTFVRYQIDSSLFSYILLWTPRRKIHLM